MKFIFSLLILFFSISIFAQPGEWKGASKESLAYHQYRTRPTIPPYGLVKVKDMIKQIKADDDDNEALSQEAYEALSFREKFTYHMIHGESYSQNCDAMPPIQDEHKKIFAFLPDAFDEYAWSDRQATFLKSNRDSVIVLMKESITRSKRVGINFKHAIIEINATEMIPFLIAKYYEIKKDLDLLTLMLQLMKENEYEPFITSGSYRKLYSEDAGYMSYLNFNKANEELIIKRARAFYNEGRK